jgi:hypothetical protein
VRGSWFSNPKWGENQRAKRTRFYRAYDISYRQQFLMNARKAVYLTNSAGIVDCGTNRNSVA